MVWSNYNKRGTTLVEVLVVASILLLVFGGLLYGYKYTLDLVLISRSKLTALALMNSKMEYVQSLAYDAVGTQGGIPAGLIPQNSTTTLNGIAFNQRVLVEYVDDPADGLGVADSNGITTDYKRVKIEYTWVAAGIPQTMFLVSNIVPRSIESDVGGGTLRVNVFNAGVNPMPGAQVRLINSTQSPAIDVTRFTDSSGIALFGGTPAGSGYELLVTRPGYSQDQTYQATTDNPNPVTLPVTVLEADVTTMNFFIDTLSSVLVRAFADKSVHSVTTAFSDMDQLATSTNVTIIGDELQLADVGSGYAESGKAYISAVTPSAFAEWGTVQVLGSEPADTTLRWSVYQSTDPPVLIPDSDLTGNSEGFSLGAVDISDLNVTTYPSVQVGVSLTTVNAAITPAVAEVITTYIASAVPRSGVAIELTSQKSIGTDDAGQSIPKHQLVQTTNSSGEASFSAIEWGAYNVQAGPYTIAEACAEVPHVVPPGTTTQLDLVLVAATTHTARIVVTSDGSVVSNAVVTLSRPGFSATETTSSCGQVFFDGLTAADDYVLAVTSPSYPALTIDPFTVASTTVQVVSF